MSATPMTTLSLRLLRGACLAACIAAPAAVPAAETSPAAPDPAPSGSSVSYARMASATDDSEIGHAAYYGNCSNRRALYATEDVAKGWTNAGALAFKREAPADHVTGSGTPSPFDTDTTPKDADYKLGGALLSMNVDLCFSGSSIKGSIDSQVRWDFFSNRLQRVVLSRTLPAVYRNDDYTSDTNSTKFAAMAFGASMRTLFADPEVRALLAAPPMAPPPPPPPSAPEPVASAPEAPPAPTPAPAKAARPAKTAPRPAAKAASATR
jgi:hypothetical protein